VKRSSVGMKKSSTDGYTLIKIACGNLQIPHAILFILTLVLYEYVIYGSHSSVLSLDKWLQRLSLGMILSSLNTPLQDWTETLILIE
jgi:hypothetical protein